MLFFLPLLFASSRIPALNLKWIICPPPPHFYLLNALSLLRGLLRAIGLRHRGPLISNSVNIGGRRHGFFFFFFLFFCFNVGLRRHRITPLVYSSSRIPFHYTISSSPLRSQSNRRCAHYSRTAEAGVSISYYLIIPNQWLFTADSRTDASAKRNRDLLVIP